MPTKGKHPPRVEPPRLKTRRIKEIYAEHARKVRAGQGSAPAHLTSKEAATLAGNYLLAIKFLMSGDLNQV
jgi:hypothetical protein